MTTLFLRLSGLVVAPIAWASSTQLGQILPYTDCRTSQNWSAAISLSLTLLTLMAALMPARERLPLGSHADLFVNRLSLLVGLTFAFAMLMQSAATLLVDPCQR